MRTPEEIEAQLRFLEQIADSSGEASDVVMALQWVIGIESMSPADYWADYAE